jgi:2-dehydropantoate 2-reductase
MRICVFGAGAIGGHLAAKLAAAGHAVSAVARGANLEAVRKNGFKLIHGDAVIAGRVRAAEHAAELGAQEAVIVTLKANALSAFARDCAPLLQSETAVVFAQNGVPWWYASGLSAARPRPPDLSRLDPGGLLAAAIPRQNVLGAIVYSANDLIEPGVVRNYTPGDNMLVIGESDDRASARIIELRRILEESGVSSPATHDIRQVVWNKLHLSLGTGTLCLLAGCTVGEMRGDARLSEIARRVAAEGRAIAAAHGVDADKAPPRPSGGHASGAIGHKPSILQDYEARRPMEIEAQLAAPLAFARAMRVATPTLDVLVPLAVHKAASRGLYTT